MKIALIGLYPLLPSRWATGPARVYYELCHSLRERSEEVIHFYSPIRPKDLLPWNLRSLITGVPDLSILPGPLMLGVILARNYDLIHLVGLPGKIIWLALRFWRGLGSRLLYSASGIGEMENEMGYRHSALTLKAEKLILRRSRLVTTVSEDLRHEILQRFPQLDERCVITVPNGVGLDFFQPTGGDKFRETYHITQDERVVLALGGTKEVKGLEFFLEALRGIERTDYVVVIAGPEGNQHDLIMHKYVKPSNGRIRYIGMLTPVLVQAALDACDIYVQPSKYESFGLASLEAMAAARPVIVSDRVGMRYLIQHGENGFVLEYGNVMKWRELIEQLLDNGELRTRVGASAQARAKACTWDSIADQFIALYGQLAEQSDENIA